MEAEAEVVTAPDVGIGEDKTGEFANKSSLLSLWVSLKNGLREATDADEDGRSS